MEFNETRAGVKGLVDSGIKHVPKIFIHLAKDFPKPSECHDAGLDASRRKQVINEICEASETWGFFQLVNHGVPLGVLDGMIQAATRFHEQDTEVNAKLYSRNGSKMVKYSSNFDLFTSPAANWRDTFSCFFYGLSVEELPSVLSFREEISENRKQLRGVADTVSELLSEALGLKPAYLKSMDSTKGQAPPCPEPELTLGTTKHSEPAFLTLLLRDDHGGLQVLQRSQWVRVTPVSGALVVNIGDFLQLISNDKFTSVVYRMLASHQGPRLPVVFFNLSRDEERFYGPIKEALSDENLPLYREVLVRDYLEHFTRKGLGGECSLSHFNL